MVQRAAKTFLPLSEMKQVLIHIFWLAFVIVVASGQNCVPTMYPCHKGGKPCCGDNLRCHTSHRMCVPIDLTKMYPGPVAM
ncbi:hypothetical protein BJV82DRAFT_618380 [Fennellomyces sp. T-0311]|nr:hypothetical protein BJV82DRAFT_618380 [Fennellomyces sp. T-0311]